ncbi:hypothetical protein ACLMJK_007711 [Lecanora helva]
MSTLMRMTILTLLLLCGSGFYGTWYILLNNGTTAYMSQIRDVGPRYLPGTFEPVKTVYIGIPSINYQLTVLTLFFWQLVDGSHPSASLFSFHFATQVACGWGLLMMEGLRRGHRWKIISFIGTLGILVQNLAYAVIVPIYLIIYFLTTPLLSSKRLEKYTVEKSSTLAIPISIVLGYMIPAILMSLPAPSIITFDQKQTFIAVWQMFPLWVAILQAILPYSIAALMPASPEPSKHSGPTELNAMRQVYAILLMFAGIGQTATATILALLAWFPELFAPEVRSVFDARSVLVPMAATPATRMPSIGDGAFLLLQYDELVGSMSMASWASIMYLVARQQIRSQQSIVAVVLVGFAAMVCTGPLGFCVACIWARDELIARKGDWMEQKSE